MYDRPMRLAGIPVHDSAFMQLASLLREIDADETLSIDERESIARARRRAGRAVRATLLQEHVWRAKKGL